MREILQDFDELNRVEEPPAEQTVFAVEAEASAGDIDETTTAVLVERYLVGNVSTMKYAEQMVPNALWKAPVEANKIAKRIGRSTQEVSELFWSYKWDKISFRRGPVPATWSRKPSHKTTIWAVVPVV